MLGMSYLLISGTAESVFVEDQVIGEAISKLNRTNTNVFIWVIYAWKILILQFYRVTLTNFSLLRYHLVILS
jgi:hypothetical protein